MTIGLNSNPQPLAEIAAMDLQAALDEAADEEVKDIAADADKARALIVRALEEGTAEELVTALAELIKARRITSAVSLSVASATNSIFFAFEDMIRPYAAEAVQKRIKRANQERFA